MKRYLGNDECHAVFQPNFFPLNDLNESFDEFDLDDEKIRI